MVNNEHLSSASAPMLELEAFSMETKVVPGTASVILPGTVETIIKGSAIDMADVAQILLDGDPRPYREIRIDNILRNGKGDEVSLKVDAHVKVTIKALADATIPK